ncbi:MAG: hypothetical protein E6J79_15955 [Deltaproteobacteria bacterium]|nr:MAG: hypothetical protein E6J79_15955 [Deltaproteobacteria bacterium]
MTPKPRLARAAAMIVLAAAACRPDCAPRAGQARTNVVLVTIDTLRADHLGCYGNRTVRTPELDRLAAEGALFERCYSQAHLTVPSHLTILTSLPPAEHGVLDNGWTLRRHVDALPGVFAHAGYRTAAFVGAKHVGPEGPLGPALTGLEVYKAPWNIAVPYRAEETNRNVLRWLRGACRDPFFVWIHYWDPHMPYTPPGRFDRAYYRDDPYDPRHTSMAGVTLNWFFYEVAGVRRRLGERASEVHALKQELGLSSRQVRALILDPVDLGRYGDGETLGPRLRRLRSFLLHGLPLKRNLADWLTGVRDLRFPLAQYAGEVSYVDREVGRLRDGLRDLGLADRTVLVITADHGESLGEHGIYFDHFGLHEPNLHVPLVVWAPGRIPPRRYPEPVRSLDIAPTVLRLAGLAPPAAMEGRDLFDADGKAPPVVSEAMRGLQIMILSDRWKLIRSLQSFYYNDAFSRQTGTTELYDLGADPGEADNVVASHAEVAAALGDGLDAWVAARHADGVAVARPAPIPRERLEQLRALGYVE